MATARVFKSGNSQAVRLPKAFRLKGPEVEISRRGDEIVLREKHPRSAAFPKSWTFWLRCQMTHLKVSKTNARPRSAKGCNGPALYARHEYLHLHSRKAAESSRPVREAGCRRSGHFHCTYGELAYGGRQECGVRPRNRGLERFIAAIPVLPMPVEAGQTYGKLRAALEMKGEIIGPNDL